MTIAHEWKRSRTTVPFEMTSFTELTRTKAERVSRAQRIKLSNTARQWAKCSKRFEWNRFVLESYSNRLGIAWNKTTVHSNWYFTCTLFNHRTILFDLSHKSTQPHNKDSRFLFKNLIQIALLNNSFSTNLFACNNFIDNFSVSNKYGLFK